ncbi:hypothetical protein ANCDUO_09637 [Ancylostoma duodenale]|uniref:SGF29 C-terminal domain-containing protein n=1 Tax=Ancylostoma duodenale TaxID=51022 RepID=A0A0C2CTB5_9BILA|nr:hypothetical protein ANCDUO_09637 [Ancylostoma duodenale]
MSGKGTTLPLWIGGVDGFPPPFVGAIAVPETVPLKSGDSVAAYVRLTMARRRLIPLPKWRADPERDAHALFPLEAIVLALYPQTTCFYKGKQRLQVLKGMVKWIITGVVQRVPQLATDDYLVTFEDPSYSTGYSPPLPIPQRYVVPFKEIKGKNKSRSVGSD